MDITVRSARSEERSQVGEFFRGEGYGGGTASSDDLVVAREGGLIVGAFRLAREHGVLVLRGMRVRTGMRRRGVGLRLLEHLAGLEEPCYCVPRAYLEDFYGRAGFSRLPGPEAPTFLRDRAARYRELGLDVIVMKRAGR
jgi:N-acetylglutamate synthase-like GNAT family acetyltransferase